jgi:hypothetical protein
VQRGTFLFELAGMSTSSWHLHPTFSCYSMSLSLANHPMVDGWDADVIAEDHHMFIKCKLNADVIAEDHHMFIECKQKTTICSLIGNKSQL